MSAPRRAGLLLWAFLLLLPAAGRAQEDFGVLELRIDPQARVAVEPKIDEGIYRLRFFRQQSSLTPQLSEANQRGVRSWNVVPQQRGVQQVELQLHPDVRDVELLRPAPDLLVLAFRAHRFSGAAERRSEAQRRAAPSASAKKDGDSALEAILLRPTGLDPRWLPWGRYWFPIGMASPVRPDLRWSLPWIDLGAAPPEARRAFAGDADIGGAIVLLEAGYWDKALAAIERVKLGGDRQRALRALAKAWILAARYGTSNQGHRPDRAAEGFLMAAAMDPDARWVPWAWATAGWLNAQLGRMAEAQYLLGRALAAAPKSALAPRWRMATGFVQIADGDWAEGITSLAATLGASELEGRLRYEGRLAAAVGLWSEGDSRRAARVVDLLLRQHPGIAAEGRDDALFARIFLDGGRPALATPLLERIERDAEKRVQRERARWWLHEAALGKRDLTAARRYLNSILDRSPSSVLVPLATARLMVLDSVANEQNGDRVDWNQLNLDLRRLALNWPYTPVEDEALSYAAQLDFQSGQVKEGLRMLLWIEGRTPREGGAVAFQPLICRHAVEAFQELRHRGEYTRAIGLYRSFLEDPRVRACVDPDTRLDAASTALAAGLNGLASRMLGRAAVEGMSTHLANETLVRLALLYLEQGKLEAASRTLDFVEQEEDQAPVRLLSARGDVARVAGQDAEALRWYDRAILASSRSVRSSLQVPSLRLRRSYVAEALGRTEEAVSDLTLALASGALEAPALGWRRLARLLSTVADEDAEWETVLTACTAATATELPPADLASLRWIRVDALQALGRADEATELLDAMADSSDAWGLLARERQGEDAFDSAVEAALNPSLSAP